MRENLKQVNKRKPRNCVVFFMDKEFIDEEPMRQSNTSAHPMK